MNLSFGGFKYLLWHIVGMSPMEKGKRMQSNQWSSMLRYVNPSVPYVIIILPLCNSITLFLILMPWSWSFFLELTLPYLCSWGYTLTHQPLILYMDLELPCLRPQPYSRSPSYTPGALWGSLPSFPMGLHMKVLHMAPIFFFNSADLFERHFLQHWPTSAVLYYAVLYSDFDIHSGPGTPQYLTTILSIRGWLGEPTYHSSGSSQVNFFCKASFDSFFFKFTFLLWKDIHKIYCVNHF